MRSSGGRAGIFVTLRVTPPFFRVVGGLRFIVLGNIGEHEPLAVLVAQDAAFAAHAFGDEDAHDAGRPDHAGRMKLHELHVNQFRAGMIGQRLAVAGVFPGVAGDFIGATNAAGGQHDGFRLENLESSALAVVAERADNAVAVLEQRDDRVLHVDFDALMDAVVLQRADQFQAGAVADVGESRIAVAAEIALKNSSHRQCDRTPRPRLRARGRGRALPWRAVRPCASC